MLLHTRVLIPPLHFFGSIHTAWLTRRLVLCLFVCALAFRTTFGEKDVFADIRSMQADNVMAGGVGGEQRLRGEIDALHVDEDQHVVSIIRKYIAGEHKSEIIDVMWWDRESQQITRHHSYGFCWQREKRGKQVGAGEGAGEGAGAGGWGAREGGRLHSAAQHREQQEVARRSRRLSRRRAVIPGCLRKHEEAKARGICLGRRRRERW